jgi:hypothetical protein
MSFGQRQNNPNDDVEGCSLAASGRVNRLPSGVNAKTISKALHLRHHRFLPVSQTSPSLSREAIVEG